MNMPKEAITDYMSYLRHNGLVFASEKVDVAVFPPSLYINATAYASAELPSMHLSIGAQNVYWESSGAFTGEESVNMIKDTGCSCCIVGHSERRMLFGETDDNVSKKAKALLKQNIAPIVCVGDSLEARNIGGNVAIEAVLEQISYSLKGLTSKQIIKTIIAYEPIWAIGTGEAATPEQAQEMCCIIRQQIERLFGKDSANKVRIIYGGSVNNNNAELFACMPDIDGALVGGASLNSEKFLGIIKAFA